MSGKYANLPDIDSAPDVYESADVATVEHVESSDDDALATPSRLKKKKDAHLGAATDELDASSLLNTEKAVKKFKRAERNQRIPRTLYTYPESPSPPASPSSPVKQVPLAIRLNTLRAEISSLELEIADPSNPLLQSDDVNAGELMRGLLDVRSRLQKIGDRKEGRGRLVDLVTSSQINTQITKQPISPLPPKSIIVKENSAIIDIDQRVKELEDILGSPSSVLDDSSSMTQPLLSTIHRINSQLAILTQPKHIDAISRRLKLLLTDLDRMGASQNPSSAQATRRQSNQLSDTSGDTAALAQTSQPLEIQEQILQILTRLSPHLGQLPPVISRLRTLSALHTSAASFDSTMATLESKQGEVRKTLQELSAAVDGVSSNLVANDAVIKSNVSTLEKRVMEMSERITQLE